MRNALTATCLLAFTQFAMVQSASPNANTDVLTVRISENGVCHFLDDSAPCEQLGKYLLTKGLAQNRHLHIAVDRASKYELVAATLKSLEGTGFKVGFINSEPSKPAISDGNYIGYATVADALATLKAQGLMPVPGINGEVSFADSDNKTTWTFVGKDNPAYPSAVRYVFARSDGPVLHVEITILCEASEAPCEKFRSDTRDNVTQLSKMMAGDPPVKCRVNDVAMKCGAEPIRKQTNQQIYVQVGDDGNCFIDSVATACLDIGEKIRAEHPSDDPKVNVCASEKSKYDVVGKVLGALSEEHLSSAFGCPPH